jgi:hypothetical protein
VAVLLIMRATGVLGVLASVGGMSMCGIRVVPRLLMIAALVVFCGFRVMAGCVSMMF